MDLELGLHTSLEIKKRANKLFLCIGHSSDFGILQVS